MNNVISIYIFVVLFLNAQLISRVMMYTANFHKFLLWLLVPSYNMVLLGLICKYLVFFFICGLLMGKVDLILKFSNISLVFLNQSLE